MKAVFDIRMDNDWAVKHLGSEIGKPLVQGPGLPIVTRQLKINATDPLVEKIREKVISSERRGETFFCFVNHEFRYEEHELNRASLLHLKPQVLLRTFGERHGTEYEDTNACPKCGSGRVQVSPLIIDQRQLAKQKKADFIVTITSDELIVSAKLANLLRQSASDHCTLGPIHDLRGDVMSDWFQLKVRTIGGVAVPPTKFGINFFHPDDYKGEYVCAEHCLSGLNILSELFVQMDDRHEIPPVSMTKNRVGRKAGWIVPAPLLLVSRSMANQLRQHNIAGIGFEVAHIVQPLGPPK